MEVQGNVAEIVRRALEERQELVAVYLFGSVAQGRDHALSDVDVAVLFSGELAQEAMFDYVLEIGSVLEDALHRPVDVIALNRASPALRFQVLKSGRLLHERDHTARCLFVMRALNQYYDVKPYLDYHNAQLVSKISQEGLGRGYHGHHNALAEARQLSAHLASDAGRLSGRIPE